MDIKSILPNLDKDKDGGREFFWSLVIEPTWIQAGLWRILEDKAQVVYVSNPVAWKLDEELISAADNVLSSIQQELPDGVKDPTKTVFGVMPSWVKEGEIVADHIGKIKAICSELSLEPTGFVVLSEAIAHLIKSEEGSPLSAVVMGVSEQALNLSVFRLGSLAGSTEVARSMSIVDDIVEGLSRLSTGDSFPSRFVLYDGKEGDLEDVRQELAKAEWDASEKVKFLHSPKAEIISAKRKVDAVSLAGASEMADVVSLVPRIDGNETNLQQSNAGIDKQIFVTKDFVSDEVENVSKMGLDNEVDIESLGFVVNHDVSSEPSSDSPAVDDPVKSTKSIPGIKLPNINDPLTEDMDAQMPTSETKEKNKTSRNPLTSFSKAFSGIGKLAHKLKLPKRKPKELSVRSKNPLVVGLVIFLIILSGLFAAWWFLPKATVSVYVGTKRLEERMEIVVSSDAVGENSIPGEILKTSVSGEKTKSTTGTKTVGDKASGEVTIYRVGPKLNLDAGTTISNSGGLKFSLDEDVVVASGSAGTPGTTNAKVTALDIGADYNLTSGTVFTVSNYSTSDMEAKNENSFSGGTSREISAVSSSDQSELKDDLLSELTDKGEDELRNLITGNNLFVQDSMVATPSGTNYSNKVGDEATTLKLTMNIDLQALSIDKARFNELVRNRLESKIPDGFVLRDEQIKVEFEYEGEKGSSYSFTADVSANLLPEIDPEKIANEVSGKYPAIAKKYLIDYVPGFSRAEINFTPKLPGKLGTLPHITNNIEVEVVAEK